MEASKCPPTEAEVGIVGEPTHSFDEEGDGSRDSSGIWTCFSSRRRGDGTCGRSTDPKQGRSRRQPRPDRRAKAACITKDLGKSGGAGETGGSGRSSGDEGDTITLSEQRARGPRWLLERARGGLVENASRVTQEGVLATKTTSNRDVTEGMRIWRFTLATSREGRG